MDNIPPSTRSSLLIDLEMGKRIEVEALQGAAVRRAAKHGLPMPIISTLYAVLKPWADGPVRETVHEHLQSLTRLTRLGGSRNRRQSRLIRARRA